MNDDVIVSVRNLSKKYKLYNKNTDRLKELFCPWEKNVCKDFFALKDISFEVKRGESIAIVGKNGSGKSTLLKILTGVLTPTEGSVSVNGKVSALLELGAGFNSEYSGLDNIYMTGTLMGYTKEQMNEKLQEIIDFADIGDFLYQPVKTYSSGMYVRLAFAVAINVDPDILIVDEALAVGDIRFQRKCFRKIEEFKKNKTFILVSHDMTSITKFSDRVIWIDEGILLKEGDPIEITDEFRAFMIESKYNKGLNSTDRNKVIDTEFIPFDDDLDVMGDGICSFSGYLLLDENGNKLSSLKSGEMVQLWLNVKANDYLEDVIVGFTMRNKLGDVITQTNSFLMDENFSIEANQEYVVKFSFELPKLLDGFYTISPAIATGTQSYHTQHCWIFDAIIFEVVNKNAINLEGVVYIDKASCSIE